jgi:hypothetical protein
LSSLRDRIAAAGLRHETITIPEWDVTIEVRSISVRQRADLLKHATRDDEIDMGVFSPLLVIASVYDPETGEPAFTADDVDLLMSQPAGLIDRLVKVAMQTSGLDAGAIETGKDGS